MLGFLLNYIWVTYWQSFPWSDILDRLPFQTEAGGRWLRVLFARYSEWSFGEYYFRYQLHSNHAGNSLPFRHPRFIWLKHRRLQNQHPPKYQTGAGYDPHGNRKRRGHCRAATPQWPRLSICFSKLFCPNYAIRHYSVYVKTGEPIRQCYGRKFLFHSQIRMHSSFQAGDHPRSTNAHWWFYHFLHPRTYST